MLPFNEATFGRVWDYDDGVYRRFALIPYPPKENTWLMVYEDDDFDLIGTKEDFNFDGFCYYNPTYNYDLLGEITDLFCCTNFCTMCNSNHVWHRNRTRPNIEPINSMEKSKSVASPQKVKVKIHKRTAAKQGGKK